MVKDSMCNEEIRRKDMGVDTSQALVIENRGRSKNKGLKGHSKSRCKSQMKGKFSCYHYGKDGHIKRNCKVFKKEQKGKKI
uniref:CCHC-type domain-containing protein n=1 Tax=Manihot esculenta TaxID=3983 RepID=A0A2C9VLZ0_MANES